MILYYSTVVKNAPKMRNCLNCMILTKSWPLWNSEHALKLLLTGTSLIKSIFYLSNLRLWNISHFPTFFPRQPIKVKRRRYFFCVSSFWVVRPTHKWSQMCVCVGSTFKYKEHFKSHFSQAQRSAAALKIPSNQIRLDLNYDMTVFQPQFWRFSIISIAWIGV